MADCVPHLNGKATTYDAIKKQLLQDRTLLSKYVPNAKTDVPPMPFSGNGWKQLGLKLALRKAIESGADSLSWTTGDQQAERYDLSKHVNEVGYVKTRDGNYDLHAIRIGGGGSERLARDVPESKLSQYVGKDLADKIAKGEGESTGGAIKSFHGLDLKVGGEGMRGFYSKELINLMNDLVKKWNVRVGTTELKIPLDQNKPSTWDDNTTTVHSVPITDKMREDVTQNGFSLFQPKTDNTGSLDKAIVPKTRSPLAIPRQDDKRKGLEAISVR